MFDQKKFNEEMAVCDPKKHTRCIDPHRHNLGCVSCPVEAGLYDAPVDPDYKEEEEHGNE